MLEKRERNATILELVKNGASYAEVGRDYGITRARVSQICVRSGIRSYAKTYLSDEQEEQIERLHWQGMRPAHIAQETGCTIHLVSRFLDRTGLRKIGSEGIKRDLWDKYEDETVRRLYGAVSAARIGEKLGRTRCEVIGRANRLGLTKHTPHLRVQGGKEIF